VWNDLNKRTKQRGLQIGLGSCSMDKWMKGNVWGIQNVKRVSVKPEKNIVNFLKYFKNISWNVSWNISRQKISWNFTSQPRVYRGKHVVLRPFYSSYLKANKVSKTEWTRKVEYAYRFWKCEDAALPKIIKISPCMLVETTTCQIWRVFFATQYIISIACSE